MTNRTESPRILVAAHDPGGGNMLLPIITQLQRTNANVHLCAHGPSAQLWRAEGWSVSSSFETCESVFSFVEDFQPDLVLTGTSIAVGDGYRADLEIDFCQAAKDKEIPTAAGIDARMNLQARFTHTGTGALVVPDDLCAPDQWTRDQLAKEAWCTARIHTVGQPHLERVIKNIRESRNKIPSNARPLMVFFSEPVGLGITEEQHPGFTQYEVVKLLLHSLSGLAIDLLIQPHPLENSADWRTFLESVDISPPLQVDVSTQTTPALQTHADVIFGIGSIALIETAMAGIPTAALQPNRKHSVNPRIDAMSNIQKFYSRDGIEGAVRTFATTCTAPVSDPILAAEISHSCERFLSVIAAILRETCPHKPLQSPTAGSLELQS
ncbi:hypothetical protein [Magnetovibrio sp.]|uniref:hypothetical protein n=1 Tax=Magnetovibrio sp. TaxID=2024836 RepID=UPI002F920E36